MKTKITCIVIAFLGFNLLAQNKDLEKDLKMYSMVWDNIINKGDFNYFSPEYFDDNVTLITSPENVVGIDALKAYWETFLSGFSNVEFTIVKSFGQGDDLVKHWHFKGEHTGDFFGIPASGKMVDMEGTTLIKMKNGKIAQEQDFYDSSIMMQQLGVVSSPDNVGVINAIYEKFGEGDIPGVLALMDKEIVWNEAESNSLADGNPYKGPEAVLNGVFARLGSMYKSFTLKDIQLHDMSENQVLATLYYNIDTKDGKHFDVQAAHHWTLNDGKIVAFQQYADTKKLDETGR